jgi:thioesterase domain-containing protein
VDHSSRDCQQNQKVGVYNLKNGSSVQLFAVHGAGGILFLGNLIPVLNNDIQFKAIQLSGIDRTDMSSPGLDIVELSKLYADEIGRLNSGDPLFVCGLFGPIVLETGQRLLERKMKVAALIVFDSVGPTLPDSPPTTGMIRRMLIKPMRKRLNIRENKGIKLWIQERLGLIKPVTNHRNAFGRQNSEFTKHYSPKVFLGLIWLIRSEEFAARPSKIRHLETWSKIAMEFKVIQTTGTHYSMWDKPYINDLGNVLNKIMNV